MGKKFDYSNLDEKAIEQIVLDRCDSIRNSTRWGLFHESLLAEDDFEDLVRESVQTRVTERRSLYERGIYEDVSPVARLRFFHSKRRLLGAAMAARRAGGLLPLDYTQYDSPPACDILYSPAPDPKSGIMHWRLREEYYDLVHDNVTEAPLSIRVSHANEAVGQILEKYNLDACQLRFS